MKAITSVCDFFIFKWNWSIDCGCEVKGLGSQTINFCPADMEKNILQRTSKYYNGYKI